MEYTYGRSRWIINMGNHMKEYLLNQTQMVVPSIFRDEDHLNVDPL